MIVNKPVNLNQLESELSAAGITVRGLGQTGVQVHTYDVQGVFADLPAAAASVLAAHRAAPTEAEQDRTLLRAIAAGTQPATVAQLALVVQRLLGIA